MFSDAGPDVRWVGNEAGVAGDPCWHTIHRDRFVPGDADTRELNSGDRDGTHWLPAECDVSIRPGWFYHPAEDDKVRPPEDLIDLYLQSVGRGANLLLNLPPDRRGQIHPHDAESLLAFRSRLEKLFRTDLAKTARASASHTRGNSPAFGPARLIDGNPDTFWATDDGVMQAEAVLEFPQGVTFDILSLREVLPLGQRVDRFAIDVDRHGHWHEHARGSAIGNHRLIRGPLCTTTRVRLRVIEAAACPAISEMALFRSA
jgi:alpha-L-fucosidase